MNEVNHDAGDVQTFELFDGSRKTYLLTETGREIDRWIASDVLVNVER